MKHQAHTSPQRMGRTVVATIVTVLAVVCLVATSCIGTEDSGEHVADSLWLRAYRMRYTDVDSTALLLTKAIQADEDYVQGEARVAALRAYLSYQQMDYDRTLNYCDTIYQLTDNQITLLMADVMRMKVYQRTGDGGGYYQACTIAGRRLKRIKEEQEDITGIDASCYVYARSEYHIISSTYYYYQEQDSLAKAEMKEIDITELQQRDTTQWLYYNYMMGSGGLIDGDYANVALAEFGYLADCYAVARRADIPYFEGNALQALASRLKTPYDRQIISRKYPDAMEWLMTQHLSWMPDSLAPSDSLLPMALARHALQCFTDYGDLFQRACVYRTMGELSFFDGRYHEAINDYGKALALVNQHHQRYYPWSKGTLVLYKEQKDTTVSTECQWIEDKRIKTVPEWMAAIRQQISLSYSALGLIPESNYNRYIYLGILNSTSQDREMQGRMEELRHENSIQLNLLVAAAVLLLFVVVLVVCVMMRLQHHDYKPEDDANGKKGKRTLLRDDRHRLQQLTDQLEETVEACEVSRLHIAQNKSNNAEKRAKVSLVQAVMPFLDRIINEVNRMQRQQKAVNAQLDYITELADRIVDYNEILTEWIKMQQGQLRLQIGTINLQSLFDIVSKGHFAYDQQGVALHVVATDARVKADEALTLFMINTLSDNARKFTPRGGTVTIEAQKTEQYVEVSVTDTGCGMRQEDIDTILDNKVYDASKIGVTTQQHSPNGEQQPVDVQTKKGFGFGLMNCKGIIEKYRKTSALFSVCQFGIESKLGQGSRFFFRLPRVLMLIVGMVLSISAVSAASTQNGKASADTMSMPKEYFDKAVRCNEDSAYFDALRYCDSALYVIDPQLVLFNADNLGGGQSAEFEALRTHKKWDFKLLVALRNQIAVSAMALHYWPLYTYNNNICTHLHRYITRDPNLPTYCDELAQTESATKQLTALLVMLSLIALVLTYILMRGKRKVARRMADELQEKIEAQLDVLHHLRYEESRLYVRNQVLDNCLSTIKHESMYYPSRIRQLAERMKDAPQTDDLQQLAELTSYYKELYTLLSSQAEHQTLQTGLRRERIPVADMLDTARHAFGSTARRLHLNLTLDAKADFDTQRVKTIADRTLLDELFRQLSLFLLTRYPSAEACQLSLTKDGNFVICRLSCPQMQFSPEEAHELFYPQMNNIPLLIVKQIIRDFDALMGNPGLRLMAETNNIWFNIQTYG